ncbi:hypothetical protein COO60DRAFT_1512286 [Scenedesmus sp. NREL 46B-D3]|nr:hypothetical protein COO60DRAFT_1512286 [Scenedesmus sp. NREL 46B-D3]
MSLVWLLSGWANGPTLVFGIWYLNAVATSVPPNPGCILTPELQAHSTAGRLKLPAHPTSSTRCCKPRQAPVEGT